MQTDSHRILLFLTTQQLTSIFRFSSQCKIFDQISVDHQQLSGAESTLHSISDNHQWLRVGELTLDATI